MTLLTPDEVNTFYGAIDFSIENRAAISETGFAVAKGAATIAGASGTLATASALLGTGAGATVLAATGVVAVGAVGAYVGYNYVGVPLALSLLGPGTLPTMSADPAVTQLLQKAKARQTTALNNLNSLFSDPSQLNNASLADVKRTLKSLPSRFERGTLRTGSQAGNGWTLREKLPNGNLTDRYLQWHPGGGHHGPNPYWKICSGKRGTTWFNARR